MHEGHRQRMTQRLVADGAGLQDHELLEIVLYGVIPRKNTNGVAHALLSAFGSLRGVFSAEYGQLKSVEGVGDAAASHLCAVGACFSRMRAQEERPPETFNVETFTAYLRERFSSLTEEAVEFYCLDAHDRIRQSKRFTTGERSRAAVSPEELNRFLVAAAPHGLVFAHNHPHANCAPSREDDQFTAQVQMLCSMNNVKLYDHVIVGKDGNYSYRLVGRMEEIRREFDVSALLTEKGLP